MVHVSVNMGEGEGERESVRLHACFKLDDVTY